MRDRRLIIPGRETVAHCWTRLRPEVAKLKQLDLNHLADLIKRVFYYCDIDLISYSVIPSGFDVLVRAPKSRILSDDEILERAEVLYQDTPIRISALENGLAKHGRRTERGKEIRHKHQAHFHNISKALQVIKLRLGWHYRKRYARTGQLWTNRYQNMLVEDNPAVIAEVAARVDAVPKWEGLNKNPSDYAFSSFGEAVAGPGLFRNHILTFTGEASWRKAKTAHARLVNEVEPRQRHWHMPRAYGNISVEAVKRTTARRLQAQGFERPIVKTFEERLSDLRQFKKQLGHCRPSAHFGDHRSLGKWLSKVRMKQRAGTLPDPQRKKLERIGVTWERRPPGRPRGT